LFLFCRRYPAGFKWERKIAVLYLHHQRFDKLFLLHPYKALIFSKIFDLFYSLNKILVFKPGENVKELRFSLLFIMTLLLRWHHFFRSILPNKYNMQSQTFELIVDGLPVMVKATPYDFNGETRFLVSYNGSEEYVFTRDSSLGRLAAIGDEAVGIPDTVEEAIAEKLQTVLT
jgi:hypothetical protein